jgi:hypothetical protein
LVACGVSRDAFVWLVSPPKRISRLGGHYNTLLKISKFVTRTGDKYIVTLTNPKEFRVWDAANYRLAREWVDRDFQRPVDHFTAIVFDDRRHAIITAPGVPSRRSEDQELLANYLEKHTHTSPVVGLFYSTLLEQFVMIDAIGNSSVWNCTGGRRTTFIERDWAQT